MRWEVKNRWIVSPLWVRIGRKALFLLLFKLQLCMKIGEIIINIKELDDLDDLDDLPNTTWA